MDWKALLAQNINALLGSMCTILGVIIGAMIPILLQYKQRYWALDDQRRQWKRQLLSEHIVPIQDTVEATLCMLQTLEFLSDEKFAKTAFADPFSQDLQKQYSAYLSHDAVVYRQIIALGDKGVFEAYSSFKKAYDLFVHAITKKDAAKALDAKKILHFASTLIDRRTKFLLEGTFVSKKRK